MIDDIRRNVDTEIEILREISSYSRRLQYSPLEERRLLANSIASLKRSMLIINDSIPSLIKDISLTKKLPGKKKKSPNLERVKFEGSGKKIKVTVSKKHREGLLKELSISEDLIKKLKKSRGKKEEKVEQFQSARGYLKLSNKYFLDTAKEFIDKGRFRQLSVDLRKANLDILFGTYVSMMFFTSFLSIFVFLFLTLFLLFFSVGLALPIVTVYDGLFLTRLWQVIWIPFIGPLLTFAALYFYPGTEKRSIAKRINQELPFATIHMSAISGSGIPPAEIFRIIGLSREYPYLRKEIRKVLNQINLYGYDLITALTNVSKNTPSHKLAELFSGISTTIHTGGQLKDYFEKRAETLLLSYRLEREKYTRVAETFMDVYISVVIAAPMILLLLMIMISVSGISTGFSPTQLTLIVVLAISVINILFLTFLRIKQPTY